MTFIGDGVLWGRMRDLVISIDPANEKYEIRNSAIFNKTPNSLIQEDPFGIIPVGTENTGEHSYSKFYQLKKITIPERIVTIERCAFQILSRAQ